MHWLEGPMRHFQIIKPLILFKVEASEKIFFNIKDLVLTLTLKKVLVHLKNFPCDK